MQNELLCLFDGAFETLQTLCNLNIRKAIITNGTSQGQRGKLERFNINKILIDTAVGFSKPDII
jgi:FMN phosphatase YigB (HAD superfamily)